MSQANETLTDSATGLTPGSVLRQLRIEKGLNIDDILSATRIPASKIKALENDEYEAFPAEVYLLGTIRSYAKHVGADADNLVSLLRDIRKPEIDASSEEIGHAASESPDSSGPVKIGFVSKTPYFAVIAILVVFWVLASLLFSGGGEVEQAGVEASVAGVVSPDISQEAVSQTQSPEALASDENNLAPETNIYVEDPSAVDSAADRASESSAAFAEVAAAQQTDENSGIADSTEFAGGGLALDSQQSSQNSAVSGNQSELEFSFSDDCWLQVRDRNNEILFEDIKKSGDNLRLFGGAPFYIMLGNARAVSLSIDDSPVTIMPRGSSKTLRLTLAAP